jgi:hypothetical protein
MDALETRQYLLTLCRDEATEDRIRKMPDDEVLRTLKGMQFIESVFSSPAVLDSPIPEIPGSDAADSGIRERVVGCIDSLDVRLALLIAESILDG